MVDRIKQIEYLACELADGTEDVNPVCILYNLVQRKRIREKKTPLPSPEHFGLPSKVDAIPMIHYN